MIINVENVNRTQVKNSFHGKFSNVRKHHGFQLFKETSGSAIAKATSGPKNVREYVQTDSPEKPFFKVFRFQCDGYILKLLVCILRVEFKLEM